ncbi:MAG: hypothetical protein EYC70_16000 [Planctomycetota bacterium]|nr:MAG: hypothetical protein EYC70_16000 [Planctomycetota bacterium]
MRIFIAVPVAVLGITLWLLWSADTSNEELAEFSDLSSNDVPRNVGPRPVLMDQGELSRSAPTKSVEPATPDTWWQDASKLAEFQEVYNAILVDVYEGTEKLRLENAHAIEKVLADSFATLEQVKSPLNNLQREQFPSVIYDSAAELHRLLLDVSDAYEEWGTSIEDDHNIDRAKMLSDPFQYPPEYLCAIVLGDDPEEWEPSFVAEVARARVAYINEFLQLGAEKFVVGAAVKRAADALGYRVSMPSQYGDFSGEWKALEEDREFAKEKYVDAIRQACAIYYANAESHNGK